MSICRSLIYSRKRIGPRTLSDACVNLMDVKGEAINNDLREPPWGEGYGNRESSTRNPTAVPYVIPCQTPSTYLKAIALVRVLISSASLILCVINVKTSAVDVKMRNPYCLPLRRFLPFRWLTAFLLIIATKSMLITPRRLMGRYCDEDELSSAFMEIGHTAGTFHRRRKHFSLRQRLNNYAKIEDISGWRLLRTTGILSGLVALVDSKFFYKFGNFPSR